MYHREYHPQVRKTQMVTKRRLKTQTDYRGKIIYSRKTGLGAIYDIGEDGIVFLNEYDGIISKFMQLMSFKIVRILRKTYVKNFLFEGWRM